MGGQDREFGSRFEMMRRQALSMSRDGTAVKGTIVRTEPLKGRNGKYLFICKARRPGEAFEEEFESDFFDFNPGSSFVGRNVEIYLDPDNKSNYYVNLDPLLPEIMRIQGR